LRVTIECAAPRKQKDKAAARIVVSKSQSWKNTRCVRAFADFS
jgi:hypothetical protein